MDLDLVAQPGARMLIPFGEFRELDLIREEFVFELRRCDVGRVGGFGQLVLVVLLSGGPARRRRS
jgi:hypothetical protein